MALVPRSRLPLQCAGGVLAPSLPEHSPSFVWVRVSTGAGAGTPPLLGPVPNRPSSHHPTYVLTYMSLNVLPCSHSAYLEAEISLVAAARSHLYAVSNKSTIF